MSIFAFYLITKNDSIMRYILLMFIISIALNLSAQSTSKLIKNAKTEMSKDNFKKAADILEPIVNQQPRNKEVLRLTGICFLNVAGEEEKSWRYLDKAVMFYPLGNKPSSSTIETYFFLGQSLHKNHKFDQAANIYEKLLKFQIPKDLESKIKRELEYSKNAMELVKKPRDFKIISMGDVINSPYDEHSPLVALDESTFYFTSNRPTDEMSKFEEEYFENIFVSYWRDGEWTKPQILELPGEYFGNRATVSISADGNTMIIYQNDGFKGSLYTTRLGFKGWTEPVPLPVNSSNSTENHACFSPDGTEIWFVSDRAGGFGGKDIWVSRQLPDGSWGEPTNAGTDINSEYDEDSPFISPDGSLLYFSSQGHNSMGGFDIFVSRKGKSGAWLKAENIGYPVNTPNDDIFVLPTPDEQRIYLSSRRKGGKGGSDLYVITFPEEDSRALCVLAGHIFYPDKTPNDNAIIRVTDEKGDLIGVYRPNAFSGKFSTILPSGFKYFLEIDAEGYKIIHQEVNIPLRDVYGTRQRAAYLPYIILEEN